MDGIRSSYRTRMILWQGDTVGTPVRWFFAPTGAQVLPVPTVFCSSNWDTSRDQSPLGEQYPRERVYSRGQNFQGYRGQDWCGPLNAFEFGGVHGVTPPIATDALGYSPCCGPLNQRQALGGGYAPRSAQWMVARPGSGFAPVSQQSLGERLYAESNYQTTAYPSWYGSTAVYARADFTASVSTTWAAGTAVSADMHGQATVVGTEATAWGPMQTWIDQANVQTGNPIAFGLSSSAPYNWVGNQSPPANGDTLYWDVYWPAGTWTLKIMGATESVNGITEVTLDGTLLGTIDWYSASLAWGVVKSVSVTIPAGGLHILRTIVAGKNTSSTNYYFTPTKLWIQ